MPSKTVQQKIARATTPVAVDLNLMELQHLLQIHLESYDRDKHSLVGHSLLVNKLGVALNKALLNVDESDD